MGVVAIRDTADRMPQDLDRRLGDVLVIVRRASLPQILQLPRLLLAGLNVQPGLDACEATERLEANVRTRTTPEGRRGRRGAVLPA
jgi:hypothetical protein